MPTVTGHLVNGDSNNNRDFGVNVNGFRENGQMDNTDLLEVTHPSLPAIDGED